MNFAFLCIWERGGKLLIPGWQMHLIAGLPQQAQSIAPANWSDWGALWQLKYTPVTTFSNSCKAPTADHFWWQHVLMANKQKRKRQALLWAIMQNVDFFYLLLTLLLVLYFKHLTQTFEWKSNNSWLWLNIGHEFPLWQKVKINTYNMKK